LKGDKIMNSIFHRLRVVMVDMFLLFFKNSAKNICHGFQIGGSRNIHVTRISQQRSGACTHQHSAITSHRFMATKPHNNKEDTHTRQLRKQLKKQSEDEDEKNGGGLEWESFDFSDSPKWDPRFQQDGNTIHNFAGGGELNDDAIQEEARQDELLATRQREQRKTLHSLSPDIVQKSIAILSPYVQKERYERISDILSKRTRHTQFLFENPTNPSNVWACLRTMDSFGIQHVHIVTESSLYQGKAALLQKQGMRTAMGSAQWLTIHHYVNTEEALRTLREEHNCRILASDLNPSSIDIRDIDWNRAGTTTGMGANGDDTTSDDNDIAESSDKPLCIVMGNELNGISDTMRELADLTFHLPMCGFAESFNLSVATAITLAHLSAASGHHNNNDNNKDAAAAGPLRPGDLPEDELNGLVLRGLIHSISQKRVAQSLLKQQGIVLPDSLYQKGINLGKKLKDA